MREFRYFIHGLALSSPQALPVLGPQTTTDAKRDIALVFRETPPWAAAKSLPQVELLRRVAFSDGSLVRCLERVTTGTDSWLVQRFNEDVALAFTEDGRRLCVFGGLVQDLDYVSAWISGPAASFLRWLSGLPSLHASSVVVDGHVLAVCGESGAGKTTTVAALALRGHQLFSDEVLGWRNVEGRLLASPGIPRLKLWPDTLAALGIDPRPLRRVRSDLEKRFLPLPRIDGDMELPLSAVYFLGSDSAAPPGEIRELRGAEALAILKTNCRDDSVLTSSMRARQFEALGDLVRCVRVRAVRAHPGLERLNDFTDAIVEDFRRLLADGR